MKLTRCQMSCSWLICDLKDGMLAPAPSRMLRKICPSALPFRQPLGSVRSVASATTSTCDFPSLPWQPVQFRAKMFRPWEIDFLEYATGFLSFLASSTLRSLFSACAAARRIVPAVKTRTGTDDVKLLMNIRTGNGAAYFLTARAKYAACEAINLQ